MNTFVIQDIDKGSVHMSEDIEQAAAQYLTKGDVLINGNGAKYLVLFKQLSADNGRLTIFVRLES